MRKRDIEAISEMNCPQCKDINQCYPQIEFYKLLYAQYPNSFFILNSRNITNHIQSIKHWNNLQDQIAKCNIKGYLPSGKGKTDKDLADFMQKYYKDVAHFFNKEHQNALFLDLDIESKDAKSRLQRFFGCDKLSWQHKMKSLHFQHS